MKTIAYLRVSTGKQETEKNKTDILHFANNHDMGKVRFVEDQVSGTVSWKKRKLAEVLEELGPGDNLIVPELSRLGRSMLGILEVLEAAKRKEINVFAVKGAIHLNDSIQSTVLVGVFSMLAQVERELISARTKEALAARKAAGVRLGRKPVIEGGKRTSKLDKYEPEIKALLGQGSMLKYVAERYGVQPQTLVKWLQRRGIDRHRLIANSLQGSRNKRG